MLSARALALSASDDSMSHGNPAGDSLSPAALRFSPNDPGVDFPVCGLPSPTKAQLLLS